MPSAPGRTAIKSLAGGGVFLWAAALVQAARLANDLMTGHRVSPYLAGPLSLGLSVAFYFALPQAVRRSGRALRLYCFAGGAAVLGMGLAHMILVR